MNQLTFTHKGWFGLCPVYVGALESDAPLVHERHWLLLPLMVLSECIFSLLFSAISVLDPEYLPAWPLRVTGRLATPIERSVP